jgi:hypothetical protein
VGEYLDESDVGDRAYLQHILEDVTIGARRLRQEQGEHVGCFALNALGLRVYEETRKVS